MFHPSQPVSTATIAHSSLVPLEDWKLKLPALLLSIVTFARDKEEFTLQSGICALPLPGKLGTLSMNVIHSPDL
jgi:hypothetical protein